MMMSMTMKQTLTIMLSMTMMMTTAMMMTMIREAMFAKVSTNNKVDSFWAS